MKVFKKSTVVVSIILVFALAIGAVAAVYILQRAKIEVFNGRLDFSNNDHSSQSELFIKINGVQVGHEGSAVTYGEDAIPVLADVESRYVDWNKYVWEGSNGQALAREFSITASGDLDNLTYSINIVGNDSVIPAMRFGLITEYYDDEVGNTVSLIQGRSLNEKYPSSQEALGDGNISKGEEIKVSIAVWADAYALADLARFDDMGFSIEVIFSAGETA